MTQRAVCGKCGTDGILFSKYGDVTAAAEMVSANLGSYVPGTAEMIKYFDSTEVEQSYQSWTVTCPVNTKHLYDIFTMLDQHRRRWADVV